MNLSSESLTPAKTSSALTTSNVDEGFPVSVRRNCYLTQRSKCRWSRYYDSHIQRKRENFYN